MCSRPQFTDLTYMGGIGPCGPITIIFGIVIQSQYISLNIKFGVNRTFHVLKTPVYRFDLYGRYRTLVTDDNNFWQCYLELVYKPKYQAQCESDVPCAEDPSYRFDLYGRYRTLCPDDDNVWYCILELVYKPTYHILCESMCSRPQFTDLTYMGGTRCCAPMTIFLVVLLRVSIQA